MRRVWASTYEDKVFFLASALAFDALIAAFPFTLLVFGVMGYVAHAGGDPVGGVASILDAVLPQGGEVRSGAERFLAAVAERRDALSALGLPLFIWFSTRFYGSTRAALNDVFDTDESRSWVVGKSVDFVLVLATLLLVLLDAVVTLTVAEAPWVGRLLARLTGLSVGVVLFYLVYTVAPSRRVPWDTALVAAVVASLALEMAKILFGFYIARFATLDRLISDTNVIAVVLLVVWIYYTACVMLVGGEVAETYDLMRRQREQRAILT